MRRRVAFGRLQRDRGDGRLAALLAAGALVVVSALRWVTDERVAPERVGLPDALALAAAAGAAVWAHERVHAVAIVACGGRARSWLRWQVWPPLLREVAHDHGRCFTRGQMLTIRLLPLTLLPVGVAAAVSGPAWASLWLAVAVLAAACAHDLKTAGRLAHLPRGTWIQDHKEGWVAWPAGSRMPGRLRVVRVGDLPWPRSLRRCAHRQRLQRQRAAFPWTRFASNAAYLASGRAAAAAFFARLGPDDFAACPYHQADWQRVAAAAVAQVSGAPDAEARRAELDADDRGWLASLLGDPIRWDEGAPRLDNGQHRACALRAAGVDRCVAAGLDTRRAPAPALAVAGRARSSASWEPGERGGTARRTGDRTRPEGTATGGTVVVEKATFAAGCFWGVEAAFWQVPGVRQTTVGYTGGHTEQPTYKQVCSDTTGHAEAVLVEFDPDAVSYEELLKAFWAEHDPTTLNRQGPDVGSQYRSAVFFHSPEQEAAAKASRDAEQQRLPRPIVTEITPASTFWRAEEYHQRYFEKQGITSCPLPAPSS